MRLSFPDSLLLIASQVKHFFKARPQLLNLFVPILFFGFALGTMPVASNLSFDTDEGQELIKAVLYSRGYALYDPIWCDQPPLLSVGLSAWFNVFGTSIFSARLFVLCLASLLIWSFFNTLQLFLGSRIALVGTLLLSLSANFLRISVSVMMGLPSVALFMVSLYTLVLYLKTSQRLWLLLSGLAMAISLQFKMFTIFLIPLQFFLLLPSHPRSQSIQPSFPHPSPQKSYRSIDAALLWLLVAIVAFVAIGGMFNSLNIETIFNFHVKKDLKNVFVNENSWVDVGLMFLQDFDLLLLAGIGTQALLKKRNRLQLFPMLWLVAATLVLLNHKPVWYHHYLLLSLPLAWLASYGIKAAIAMPKRSRKVALIACTICAISIPIKLGVIQWQNHLFLAESREKIEVVRHILTYRQETRWLFTDNPIYAFRANLLVPPEVAVISRKRVASGEITREYLDALFSKYRPEQVILERFPEVYEPLKPYLETNYVKIEDSGARRHFVLKDLLETNRANLTFLFGNRKVRS